MDAHSSQLWRPEAQGQGAADSVPGEGSHPGLQTAAASQSPLWRGGGGGANPVASGPTLATSGNHSHLLKRPPPSAVTLGVRTSTQEFRETQTFSPFQQMRAWPGGKMGVNETARAVTPDGEAGRTLTEPPCREVGVPGRGVTPPRPQETQRSRPASCRRGSPFCLIKCLVDSHQNLRFSQPGRGFLRAEHLRVARRGCCSRRGNDTNQPARGEVPPLPHLGWKRPVRLPRHQALWEEPRVRPHPETPRPPHFTCPRRLCGGHT